MGREERVVRSERVGALADLSWQAAEQGRRVEVAGVVGDEDERRLTRQLLMANDLHAVHDGHPWSEQCADEWVQQRIEVAGFAADIAEAFEG